MTTSEAKSVDRGRGDQGSGLLPDVAGIDLGRCGVERRQHLHPNRHASHQQRARGQRLARAVHRQRHHRHAVAGGGSEGAAVELADGASFGEGPFRKEHQRFARGRALEHAARVHRTTVAIEPLDELRAEPAQQDAGHGHAHHLLLDDEGELRR